MNRPWHTLASRIVYGNAWIRLREDRVIRPDGGEGIYGVVEVRPSVGVLAIDEEDRLALVGQWRYPHDKFTWEMPRGGSHEGESDMLETARRELREEAGLEARHWRPIGTLDVNNGITTDVEHLFVATGLAHVGDAQDPEEKIVLRWVPFAEAVRMVLAGEITECCTVAAILKAENLRRA